MSTTITITVTVDGGNVSVSTSAGGVAMKGARRGEPLPKAQGKLRTDGDTTIDAPGKKGGIVSDMEDKDLAWWRDKLTSSLCDEPNGRFAAKNEEQLAAIETEMAHRAGGGGSGGAGEDDQIPFAPWTMP